MSNIDKIYNQIFNTQKLKSGTKYERLTAIVYKILESNNTVIHDFRLRGNGKSADHQIDIVVQKGKTKKRILIECKDYNKKIGIGIIRDFFGAVNQIQPDESYVVTTVGFTKGAVDFACDEGIKLHVLRDISERDLNKRILKINFDIIIPSYDYTVKGIIIDDEAEKEKVQNIKNQTINVANLPIKDTQGITISTLFDEIEKVIKHHENMKDKNLTKELIVKPNYIDFKGIKLDGVVVDIKITHEVIETIIEPKGIATLILQSLDNKIDKIIQDTDLSKWTFDGEGQVVSKDC